MGDLMDKTKSLYETDEHQWMLDQIELLHAKKYEAIDHGNLLQYLTEMTIRDRRELGSRLAVLLQHLLKYLVQPERASGSWAATVVEQQSEISDMLTETPSLNSYAPALFAKAYPRAVRSASAETGIPRAKFPSSCPWTMQETLAYEPPNNSG